jgi:hypothetical protein
MYKGRTTYWVEPDICVLDSIFQHGRGECAIARRKAPYRLAQPMQRPPGARDGEACGPSPLAGIAERAVRFLPERAGDGADGFAPRQAASGDPHPRAPEMFDRVADQLPKSRRETRSRHANFESRRRYLQRRAGSRRAAAPTGLSASANNQPKPLLSSTERRSAGTKTMQASCWATSKPTGLRSGRVSRAGFADWPGQPSGRAPRRDLERGVAWVSKSGQNRVEIQSY